MTRSRIPLVLSAAALLTVASAPATADTRSSGSTGSAGSTGPSGAAGGGSVTGPVPQSYPPQDDPAGDPCPFPLRTTFPTNHVVAYTYTDAAGRVETVSYRGALIARITRTDTGRSVTKNLSGDGIQRVARDGSSVLYGIGPFAVTLHPGDRPARRLDVLHGASAVRLGADGHKTILYSSRIENVCAELA